MDHIASLGLLTLGSRFKRLSDALYQEMARFYQAQGIRFDPGNFPLLHILHVHDHITVTAAAELLGISQAAVSQKAASLVKTKLARFTPSKTDRRARELSLTKQGRTLCETMEPSWQVIREALASILDVHATPLLSALTALETSVADASLARALGHGMRDRQVSAVRIVPFAPKHAALFDRLNRAWIKEYFTVEPFDDLVLTNPKKMILDKGGEIWCAELDGKVVGVCALLVLEEGMFEFTKLGVSPEARGKQVARALLRHCIARAAARGDEVLRIFTSTRLIPACTLYRSEGFVEVPMSAEQRARYTRGDIMFDYPLKKAEARKAA